ncbi:MAG: hypothetical protein U1F42_00120 [Candidatus Competibacteraceae bacterium]
MTTLGAMRCWSACQARRRGDSARPCWRVADGQAGVSGRTAVADLACDEGCPLPSFRLDCARSISNWMRNPWQPTLQDAALRELAMAERVDENG